MVCLFVLKFEKLLYFLLIASLQMPLQLPLHWPLYKCTSLFWAHFLVSALFDANSFSSVGLGLGSSGNFKALVPFFKSSLVITSSRCK